MIRERIVRLIADGLNDYERRLEGRIVEEFADDYVRAVAVHTEGNASEQEERVALLAFLKEEIDGIHSRITGLRGVYTQFTKRLARASSGEERNRNVLEFARELGQSKKGLREDRRALTRYFDSDAVTDRYQILIGELERRLAVALGRLGGLACAVLRNEAKVEERDALWKRLDLGRVFRRFFHYDGEERVVVACFKALALAVRAAQSTDQGRTLDQATLQIIYRSSMQRELNVWIQCEAIRLLETLSPQSFGKVLTRRLEHSAEGDDLFVRHCAASLLPRAVERDRSLAGSLVAIQGDPSPYVRQGFCDHLHELPRDLRTMWIEELALRDAVPQVRAAALLAVPRSLDPSTAGQLVEVLIASLRSDASEFVLRTTMHVLGGLVRDESASELVVSDATLLRFEQVLDRLHLEAESYSVRRWAAQTREIVWCYSSPEARSIVNVVAPRMDSIGCGESVSIPLTSLASFEGDAIGRTLSVLALEDFGISAARDWRRVRLTRVPVFGFRAWRFLYEWRNPAPDKRQAHPHTIGRLFPGNVHAPSAILAELAQTKIPGEPLFMASEGGYRPYLPLLDQILSTIGGGLFARPSRLYTSEGITEITPPPWIWNRWAAWARLSLRYERYARLRNWKEGSQEPPEGFLKSLERCGIRVTLTPYANAPGREPMRIDPAVARFFPSVAVIPIGDLWRQLRQYFVSVYDNSLLELMIFTAAVSGVFIGRHLYANRAIRKARCSIPLMIGGWGTRGKSGTERLKAALFSALGYGFVSKTTGCEAMFLYSPTFGSTRELFLFRPYDKATIWEQSTVLKFAEKVGADVFLWECMALTPSYVHVLQRDWVKDDIATITNTYPDHEDLQGPAGYNIPDVMTNFIPKRSRLITTEEVMLPILAEAARELETSVEPVTWLDAGILTDDILERFPYEEHPNNIALVQKMAAEIGIDRSVALKAMADCVVADLGVLKTYPTAEIDGRYLRFTNGMSANERHGCLGNWTRMGFDTQCPYEEPNVWVTTVVNNRADRVPRSRVFARILVEDISADRHVLIGSNLNGFVGYLSQSWEEYSQGLTLFSAGESPSEVLESKARSARVPLSIQHVVDRLRAMLPIEGVPEDVISNLSRYVERPDDLERRLTDFLSGDEAQTIVEQLRRDKAAFEQYWRFSQKVRRASPGASELDREFKDLLWAWFEAKLVVVSDYFITGENVVKLIAQHTPPRYTNRVLGMQNIKGTGLDFVYRWEAWDKCHRACEQLLNRDDSERDRGLSTLTSFQEFGFLSEKHVRTTVEAVKSEQARRSESFEAGLAMVLSNLDAAMRGLREGGSSESWTSHPLLQKVFSGIEAFVDAGDAVRRRKQSDRIYRDLATRRISLDRAAKELQKLVKRQKGGWVAKTFEEYVRRWRRSWGRAMRMLKVR